MPRDLTDGVTYEARLGINYVQPKSEDDKLPRGLYLFTYTCLHRPSGKTFKRLLGAPGLLYACALVGLWNTKEWSYYGVRMM